MAETGSTNSSQQDISTLTANNTDSIPSSSAPVKDYKSMLHIYFAKHKLGNLIYSDTETSTGYVSHVKAKGKMFGSRSTKLKIFFALCDFGLECPLNLGLC
jgi:hypothetical protein